MAFSTQRATSDGTLVLLDISIEYFDRSEIAVFFDGVLSTAWSWVGSTEKKISFAPAVPNGVEVMVVRSTDLAQLRHMFSAGAAFTTQSLDEALLQILHIAQEARENATIEEVFHDLNMHGYRIKNVGAGVEDTDGANMLQMNTAVSVAENAAQVAVDAAATVNPVNLLNKLNNLSEITDDAAARANIGAQEVLVSGTNIRTVGGASLLGSGDIAIGVADGDKGDVVVSSGGTVWTLEPVPPSKLSQPFTQRVAINATSGTFLDFTSIPSWVRRITVLIGAVSTNGVSPWLVQLGDAGGVETTGYTSATQYITGGYPGAVGTYSQSTGACVVAVPTASDTYRGRVLIENLDGNAWIITASVGDGNARGYSTEADKTLSATLDRIRLTTVGGSDTFDAGKINILYE